MNETESQDKGRKLLSAVERITEDADTLIARLEKFKHESPARVGQDEDTHLEEVAGRIVSHYSTRSAVAGGLTALPAIVPGIGTLTAVLGGTLADMGLMLKFEVEMAMCLTHLFGFDIRNDRERQLAFLLASVSTYEAKSGENLLVDLVRAEGTAIWRYTPRQISKALLTVFTKIVLMSLSKGFAKALPLVGVVVSSSVNKVLTGKVGRRCISELENRRKLHREQGDEPVVDARIEDE